MNTQTTFNTTTGFGIPDIGGTAAKVMKYTRSETPPGNTLRLHDASQHGSNVAAPWSTNGL